MALAFRLLQCSKDGINPQKPPKNGDISLFFRLTTVFFGRCFRSLLHEAARNRASGMF
jgi:hypothetical protein